MKAKANDLEEVDFDIKMEGKPPWQSGLETYVFFNGTPLEKIVPFFPKQDTKVRLDVFKFETEGILGKQATILKYDKNLENTFGILDDVVMGGKSLSRASIE